MTEPNEQYDEAYFQRGSERGTKYKDYLAQAAGNRTYYEIAQTINEVFRPKRVLEIGCAIGAVVNHMPLFGIEAHGIDVSDWAVEHRLHPNIIKASADALPYESNYFDVVYSMHALEHLPHELKDKAFAEIGRVCKGFQFHMMPIIGSGPYVGDPFGHLVNLRTDPTHNLLSDRTWWANQFAATGWTDTNVKIVLAHDTDGYELSDCQLILCEETPDTDFYVRVAELNHAKAKLLSQALNGYPTQGLDVHVGRLISRMSSK
ncbi:class I SAM-dependent methyltransferase [Ensifer sp. ENS06]|uniref:class I SAM-dependent methyltransferase n=1 Tax=Ensifer sp. ENS06 TaxID=2769276 RepID=UPI001780513C|nr:class I SAM-dependent methyltransferase [Ensifer sp. ENS06]MBD9625256.1 class I SAM-dependent methyltransferase [Ensifer sp. ENS06]